MIRTAVILAVLFLVSACVNSDRGDRMRFSDAYMSCQKIADEFAEINKLRAAKPVKKEKTSKYIHSATVNAVSMQVKKYQALKVAKKREPILHKLARIRDCNFTPH